MRQQSDIPEGYMRNSQGHLVPIDAINDIDIERDQLVQEIVAKAEELSLSLKMFKYRTLGDIQAFIELSMEKYGVKKGGKKGNVSLSSFDGQYKVQRAVNEYISFDERLIAAKELIDECIHEWVESSGKEIRALIEHAFQVDKEGKVSVGRILGLTRLNIQNEKWQQAMSAITDAMQVSGSTTYVRIYQRVGDTDQFESIPLDIASL